MERNNGVRDIIIVVMVVAVLFIGGGFAVWNVFRNLAAAETEAEPVIPIKYIEQLEHTYKEFVENFIDGEPKEPPTVTQPPTNPNPLLPAAKPSQPVASGLVKKVQLFESGVKTPEANQRRYTSVFNKRSHYICLEIRYTNPQYKIADAKIPVIARFYNERQELVVERKVFSSPKKSWQGVNMVVKAGDNKAGFWQSGRYVVKLEFDGKPAGEYPFVVK